jgi:hypothetical protein
MEEHTFPLPPQQVHALDELKDEILRRSNLLAKAWILLALGLGLAALVAALTRPRH